MPLPAEIKKNKKDDNWGNDFLKNLRGAPFAI